MTASSCTTIKAVRDFLPSGVQAGILETICPCGLWARLQGYGTAEKSLLSCEDEWCVDGREEPGQWKTGAGRWGGDTSGWSG